MQEAELALAPATLSTRFRQAQTRGNGCTSGDTVFHTGIRIYRERDGDGDETVKTELTRHGFKTLLPPDADAAWAALERLEKTYLAKMREEGLPALQTTPWGPLKA